MVTECDEPMDLEKEDEKRSMIAELLLTKGMADANIRDSRGEHTPLHLCGMNGYAKVAKVLLGDNGKADVNPVNKIT